MPRAVTTSISVADPTVQYVKLVLSGVIYSLAFDFNALAVAEEISGLNLLQAFANLGSLSAGQVRGLLYAAMLKKHPKITLSQVGSAMTFESLPRVTEAIGEALRNAMPELDERNPPEPVPDPAES